MKKYKSILAVMASLLLLFCAPDSTGPQPDVPASSIDLFVSAIRIDTNANINMSWIPGTDDGYGPLDGFITNVRDTINTTLPNGGITSKVDTVPPSDRNALIVLGPYPLNTPSAGTACIVALRRGLTSSPPTCKGWTADFTDVPPPAPILDSVVTRSDTLLRDTLSVAVWYRLSPDDTNGVYTMRVRATDNGAIDKDSVNVVPVVNGSRTLKLTGYAFGSTVQGTACVTTYRRNLSSTTCKTFSQVIADKPPPPPTQNIQAILLKPDSLKLTVADSNKTYQFCTFVKFADGMVAMRTPDKNLPTCIAEYQKLDQSVRNPSPESQAIADTVQIVYSVEQVS